MNYIVNMIGNLRDSVFLDILKLTLITAEESDYCVKISSKPTKNPFDYATICIELKGSNKNSYHNIIADFENALLDTKTEATKIQDKDFYSLLGKLLKQIEDINPSFVIGFLLDKNKHRELEAFKASFY
ncbi:MAG: hypothetical protein H5U39_09535 [Deferribacterales bacterium]|nr:hypothetical protein [Deferribacterales bacterium]